MINLIIGFIKYPFEYAKARKIIKQHAYERLKFEDRDVLERIIFPYILAFKNPKKILDIGRESYQNFYNEFFKNRELWTMDINKRKKKFGSENHVTDSVVNIKKYFPKNNFDFILMNGVFGWGLNKPKEIEKALNGIYNVLKKKGVFVFGYNDTDDLIPIPLNKIKALKKFKPYYFPPLKSNSFMANTGRHTYNFYKK